jgi:hypothetical protein
MNRRRLLQAMAATSALLPAQQINPSPDESAVLQADSPDAAGKPVRRFFTAAQFATLGALADRMAPSIAGRPGAKEAETAAFLDFLLGSSPRSRQALYQRGLDALDRAARARHQKGFAELGGVEADALLAPLKTKWTYAPPADPQAAFLRAAKADVLRATANSRAVAEANAAGRRRATGLNPYWHVID